MYPKNIKILISYRREDTSGTTGRIYDHLGRSFGEENIFIDVYNIPGGADFRKHIREQLEGCDVLLAIIGPRWIGPRQDGPPRIMDDLDWPRIEIGTALQRDIPIVPVLVEGATMPTADQLPKELHSFSFLNAIGVGNGRDFKIHADSLVQNIKSIIIKSGKKIKYSNFFLRYKKYLLAYLIVIALFFAEIIVCIDMAGQIGLSKTLNQRIFASLVIGLCFSLPIFALFRKTKLLNGHSFGISTMFSMISCFISYIGFYILAVLSDGGPMVYGIFHAEVSLPILVSALSVSFSSAASRLNS